MNTWTGLPSSLTLPNLCHREEAFRQLIQKQKHTWLKRYQRRIIWRRRGKKTRTGFFRLLPGISITFGSVLLANALWPLISYFVFTSPQLQRRELVSARPNLPLVEQTRTVAAAQAATNELNPRIIRQELDFTDLNSWFPDSKLPQVANDTANTSSWEDDIDSYWINIPKVGIEKAEVKIGGTNLDESLIQYPGTAEPGREGAPVLFGHSVLRQFYNPSLKNPRRYFSIFSKIMTLQNGDEIEIEYDGIKYTYSVVDKVEVKPEDMFILEQDFEGKYLKLVTCVPEGTYLRRGVVIAQLKKTE
jgi:sortase A